MKIRQKNMPKKVKLTNLTPLEELKNKYKKETNPRVKEKLLTLIHITEGQTAVYTSQAIKHSKRSITRWVKTYNENGLEGLDRKSTRLNSSHLGISYAV